MSWYYDDGNIGICRGTMMVVIKIAMMLMCFQSGEDEDFYVTLAGVLCVFNISR